MTPYQSYQLFAAQRPKSAAEQRAADARCCELAAAIAGPITAASARICALVRCRARSWRPAGLNSRTRVIEPGRRHSPWLPRGPKVAAR
jgi:hypothetical protein